MPSLPEHVAARDGFRTPPTRWYETGFDCTSAFPIWSSPLVSERELRRAGDAEADARGIGARGDDEVVLELPARAAVDDVDAGIDVGEADVPEGRDVRSASREGRRRRGS